MWRQKEKNALCAADCFFVTHFPFRRPQSFRESARSPLFFLSFFLLFKHTGWLVMVAFSPSLKKSVYFPLTCLFAASQSLSVPLARVTHLFCLKVNVGQSSLIAKEWIYCKKKEGRKRRRRKGKKATFQWQLDTRLLKSLSVFCQPAAKPLRFLRPETMEHLKSEEGRKWPPPHFNMLPRSSDAACCVFFSVFSCLNMCVCADGLLQPTVVMTSKSAGLSVRCTLPRVRLWGGACIVSRKDREKKAALHVACIYRAISSRLQCVEDWARSLV